MLHMDKQKYLSNLSEYEELSLRKIAERSGHHFNMVKIYVSREGWNDAYKPRKAQKTRLEPLKETIDAWILEDFKEKKFKRTATKIYKDLCADETLKIKLIQIEHMVNIS
ncbi:hypothetical protein FACS1894219_04550 [Clostridia bacterium]|nr:hypothetical protein FACS1894219_04550 [Clostridia bacterium]